MSPNQVIKPERILEGEYPVRFYHAQKVPTQWGRDDLYLFFSLKDRENVILPAYFQVTWIDATLFIAGAKSSYYRSYQACIGSAARVKFSINDFEGKEVLAKVENVKQDADKDELHELNQYSRIKKMRVVSDLDMDDIPF